MGTLILMSVYLTLCLWRHRISQIQLQPEVKVMIDAKDVYCRFWYNTRPGHLYCLSWIWRAMREACVAG